MPHFRKDRMLPGLRLVAGIMGRMQGSSDNGSGHSRGQDQAAGSESMTTLERLRELAARIRPLERDGQSLLYPDGDEACRCRPDLGADDPGNLAEFIELMQTALPGLLDIRVAKLATI